MATVAEQLRQAREARNLTVQQVAEITKIRTDHLRALEEGNYDVFCAPVYIRGFVRSYSTLLKLDVPQIMAALDAELGQTKRFAEPPPLSSHSGGLLDVLMLYLSKVDWRKCLIGLGVLVLLIGLISGLLLFRHHRKASPLTGMKPGLYHPVSKAPGETLPLRPKR